MILIGSRALQLRAPHLLSRKPADFDFMATEQEYKDWMEKNTNKIVPTKVYPVLDGQKMVVEGEKANCEFELIQEGHSSYLFDQLVKSNSETFDTPFGMVPNLDLLFTLKDSHKYAKLIPRFFFKNATDWHRMRSFGCQIREEYKEFHKLREKESYSFKTPNLNQKKNDFFSDEDNFYVFEHDDIHKAVALYDEPAYLKYAKDGEEVKSDKNKFFALPEEIRLAGVIEESCVLAIERSLTPHPGVMNEKQAWMFALSKVSTSITSGFFRKFAFENLFKVIKLYPENYYKKFQDGVNSGLVRLIKAT